MLRQPLAVRKHCLRHTPITRKKTIMVRRWYRDINTILFPVVILLGVVVPQLSFAALACRAGERSLCGIIATAIDIINLAIPLAFTLALAFFLWSLVRFIVVAGNTQAAKERRVVLVWGIVVFVVLTGVWGIVAILQRTFFGQVSP